METKDNQVQYRIYRIIHDMHILSNTLQEMFIYLLTDTPVDYSGAPIYYDDLNDL